MSKEEPIARLKELGALLNREVSLTGSKAELILRIAELEEELGDEGDENQGDAVNDTADVDKPSRPAVEMTATDDNGAARDELVTVVTLATLHIDALHETRNVIIPIATPGTRIRVTSLLAADLVAGGLATNV
jgi:hypothetical protein